jgi:preprotein translocase subunit SecD
VVRRQLVEVLAVSLIATTALVSCGTDDSDPAAEIASSVPSSVRQSGTTRVTLTPHDANSSQTDRRNTESTLAILRDRVDALGLSGSRVEVDNNTFVITIPGDQRARAQSLGRTAQLYIRPVVDPPQSGSEIPGLQPPSAPQGRIFPQKEPPTPEDVAAAKASRQSADPTVQDAALSSLDCAERDPLQGYDDPSLPLITCDDQGVKYRLGPSIIAGREISETTSYFDDKWAKDVVTLTFTDTGSQTWATFTRENIGHRAAFTLDTRVISAPTIQSATPVGSPTQISGNFTAEEAHALATNLKYGSLPYSLDVSEVEYIGDTATSSVAPPTK